MWRWGGVGVAAVCACLAGCSAWGPEGGPRTAGAPPAATPTPEAAPVAATASPESDGVQRITVTVDDRLRYDPALIHARIGTVELTVRNTGSTPHTLVVPDLGPGAGVDNLDGGRVQTIRLTFTRPGRYAFDCAYHVANGMTGTIEVVEPS
jgi:plastocyanin